MAGRKENIEKIMENMHTIRHRIACRSFKSSAHMPATQSQWRVLGIVMKKGEASVKEIAETLGITSSAATQLIDGLVNKKFITRQYNSKDRRVQILRLSPSHKARMKKMKEFMAKEFTEMFEALTDEELQTYAELNHKISSKLLNNKR